MSYTELHVGTLTEVDLGDLTLEQFCEKVCKDRNIKPFNNDDWVDAFEFACYDFIIHKGKVYHLEDIKFDDEYVDNFVKNPDGSFFYVARFYNGGTCLSEILEENLDKYDKFTL